MRLRTLLGIIFLASLNVSHARAQQAEPTAAPVRLEELLAAAERNHPSIYAAARMVEARRARISQERAWPDPQLSIGYMGRIAPFRTMRDDPSSARTFGVMQEIPYPGKRDLRGQIAAKAADAETWNVEAARRRVRAEVQLAYFELWAVDKSIEITEKNKLFLEKLAEIAAQRYKVGQGLQQDLLRAQIEVTRILGQLTVLRQQRRTREAELNSLLVRPAETPIGPLAEVQKPVFAYSLEELIEKGVANSPEIRRQEQLIERNQLAVNLAQRGIYPDFSVGWDYQQRPGLPEMYGFRVSLNLPVFYKSKQRQAVSETSAELASARLEREAIRTALHFRVKEYFLAARAAEELTTLYSRALLPQSALTIEAALAAYQTGQLDFQSVLSSFLNVLDAETGYFREVAAFQKSLARLEEITGIELVK